MEESKELQGFYKIFRAVIYISVLMEFFEYAIDPAMLDHWGGILIDIHGRIKQWMIYNDGNLVYSKIATFLLICITCIGTRNKKHLEFDARRQVLYPLLKDVPYVNKILPQPEETVEQTEGTEHQYGSLSEAISQIKELEKELDEASSTNKNDKKKIKDLKAQIKDLSKYKEDEAAFEKEKEKYYEEVVFSDQAPDIQQYKTYYESIDPENAEVLYKQVVEQITYDSQVEDYAKTYSNMKPQEAASIFDTMTDNLGLVADILMNMGTQQRADILGKMDATTAAKLTEIMEPTKKK